MRLREMQEARESTLSLNERFLRHCHAVEHKTLNATLKLYHMACARGLHRILTERALAGDMSAAYGAPHWLTYSDEQVAQHA